jgi:hypothetical protein
MNRLDALAAAAKEGAGIVRVPSWQAETGWPPATLRGGLPITSPRQFHCT